MKNILPLYICILLLFPKASFCRDNLIGTYSEKMPDSTAEVTGNIRNIYLSASLGILEVGTFGLGYQINNNFSVSVIGGMAWIGSANYGFPGYATGYGLIMSYYYKKILLFNTVSIDYILYLNSSLDWESLKQPWLLGYEPTTKGYYLELNIGRQTINKSGFNIFWSVGVAVSSAKQANILYAPSLKIGINYNFMKDNK
jgi:hypothetical protein